MVVVVAVWFKWLYGLSNEAFSQRLRREGEGDRGRVMWSSRQRHSRYVVEAVGTTYIQH